MQTGNKYADMDLYMTKDRLQQFCDELGIKGEAAARVLHNAANTGYSAIKQHFPGLFSADTSKEAQEAIEKILNTEGAAADDGFAVMTVFLAAALHTRGLYSQAGISGKIFVDTMGFFKRVLEENTIAYGRLCFDRANWFRRQIAMVIFRLGTLEFEMRIMEEGDTAGFPGEKNVPVLSVHIPNDAVLTRPELDKSYKMAAQFFTKYYPDFKYRNIYCSTWLLSPVLKDLLPAHSRILEFQSDFKITATHENDSFIYWLYLTKKKIEDYSELPEDTSLRRTVKKHLLDGGKIGSASGYINTGV